MLFIARILSYLFHPIFAPLISVYILFQLPLLINFKLTDFYKTYVYIAMAVNLVVAPLLILIYFKKAGIIESIEMKSVRERRTPYLMTLLFYLFTLALLFFIHFPTVYLKIFLGASLVIAVLYFFTFLNFKVSAHLSGLGGICGMLFVIAMIFKVELTTLMILFILLSGVIASARLALKAHSLDELLVGFLLGFSAPFLVYVPLF